MPSTFFGLNVSYTGLLASNAALNTTANNISNSQTKGYSRQVVNQAAASALRTFTTYGCAGAGVDVLAIERVRNEFYDVKYWNNNSNLGEQQVKRYYMDQIQQYYADDKDTQGFNTIFGEMYKALAEVKKQAGSMSAKTQFVGYANSLTDYFNDMAVNLEEMQKDLNDEIKNKVGEINTLAQEIASLNDQINVVEMTGSKANELRDQRTLLIDKLSKIVDVEVKETPVYAPNNPDVLTGTYNCTIKIAGGQTLVNKNEYNTLSCVARDQGDKVNQSDIDGLYDITWSNGLDVNLYGNSLGGELKALIQMRDGNNGENFNGKVSGIGNQTIDGINYDTVTIDVTKEYLKDLNKCTLSNSGGKINLGNQVFSYDSWSMTKNADGSVSYSFVLSKDNETAISSSRIGKDANVGESIDYQGIPYYQAQMNEFLRIYSQKYNEILTQQDAVCDGDKIPEYLFVADDPNSNGQLFFTDSQNAVNPPWTISSTSDSYYRLTAKNFAVNDTIEKDPSYLATHTKSAVNGDTGLVDKYDIIEQLTDMKTNKNVASFRNASATEFLQCITSDVSLNAKRAEVFDDNYQNISDGIQNNRLSISGVDKDEEAINLTKYKSAYDLASKMIQTFTEIYDRLILSTGV